MVRYFEPPRQSRAKAQAIARQMARLSEVPTAELRAFFGLLRQPGAKGDVRVNVIQSPHVAEFVAVERLSRGKLLALGMMRVAGGVMERPRTYRKCRDVHDEPVETIPRPCLRCRRPFESEGAHLRPCYPCGTESLSPYAV